MFFGSSYCKPTETPSEDPRQRISPSVTLYEVSIVVGDLSITIKHVFARYESTSRHGVTISCRFWGVLPQLRYTAYLKGCDNETFLVFFVLN